MSPLPLPDKAQLFLVSFPFFFAFSRQKQKHFAALEKLCSSSTQNCNARVATQALFRYIKPEIWKYKSLSVVTATQSSSFAWKGWLWGKAAENKCCMKTLPH